MAQGNRTQQWYCWVKKANEEECAVEYLGNHGKEIRINVNANE